MFCIPKRSICVCVVLAVMLSTGGLSLLTNITAAQTGVTILCDPTFDLSQESLPSPFPGAYYLVSADPNVSVIPIDFQRITNSGTELLQSPIPPTINQNLQTPIISPDGLLMAFVPWMGAPLTVWNTVTNETASLSLPQDEADYITSDFTPYLAYRFRFQWRTACQLVIPFTTERGQIIAETTITVTENPLQLVYAHQAINNPPISVPSGEDHPVFLRSPAGNYTALLTGYPVPGTADRLRIRIYDSTHHRVFDYPPTETNYVTSVLIWTSDESTAFIDSEVITAAGHVRRLIEVSLGSPATIVPTLNSALEATFGVNFTIIGPLPPTLSTAGDSIAFEITGTTQGKNYIIFYNLTTDEIRAVCNEAEIPRSPHYLYTFWSPDDQYFGYWVFTGYGFPVIFSRQTGEVFLLPSSNAAFFTGWSEAPTSPRITDSLLALYTFDEGSGSSVQDTSGVGAPLNLNIPDPSRVTWGAGTLRIDSATLISSPAPASKIIDAVRGSNALSVELWITPSYAVQPLPTGPARIVAISQDTSYGNLVVGQGQDLGLADDIYTLRLRTSSTNEQGRPGLQSADGTAVPALTHLVYTRDPAGSVQVYVNGALATTGTRMGSMSAWNTGYRLALGNESTLNRGWLGTYHLVAFYGRALSATEVAQNYAAGAD